MRVCSALCCCILLVCSSLVVVYGNHDDEWIDPYDMLNYDATSKKMKNPAEVSGYDNVPTKRREYNTESNQIKEQSSIEALSRRPNIPPVFKRFLAKLLNGIQKLDLPSSANDVVHYDAEVRLSAQMVSEIQKLLNDQDWKPGALDDALSQILYNFKPHDYEAWKWRFEDTFGVELDTVMKITFCVFIIFVIMCTEIWSKVSWLVQFKRMFFTCFFISIVWNWFYLYQIAFAAHKAKLIKVEDASEKCSGLKKFDWKDNIKELFRTTLTLQDDLCKQYYEAIMVNPLLLVPPTKAISMTFTAFFTDPLKQIGQGISEFLRALLKDLPVTLQIPVLLTIVLAIVVFMYASAQAAIQQVALRPLRGRREDPPPPAVQQPFNPPLRDAEENHRGDINNTEQAPQRQQHAGQEGDHINQNGRVNQENRGEVRQRRPNRPGEERQRDVETLGNADIYSEDETDSQRGAMAEAAAPRVENESSADSMEHEENFASAQNCTKTEPPQTVAEGKTAPSDSGDNKPPGDTQQSNEGASASVSTTAVKVEYVESIGSPVQETMR